MPQHYQCHFDVLVVSGCSFTSSTLWLEGAASWPGYVRDRCGIPLCVDMSWPGAGNRWIADSTRHAVDHLCTAHPRHRILVLVMWTGLDRDEETTTGSGRTGPAINDTVYQRTGRPRDAQHSALESLRLMLDLRDHLVQQGIQWAFTSYCNLLFPPFIPKRDSTQHWPELLAEQDLDTVRAIDWIPDQGMDFLYEWSWKNDFLDSGDYFHPPNEANLQWTDEILLPDLARRGLIETLHV